MNKQELVAAMAAEAGLTKADSEKALNAVVSAISGALKSGDSVQLIGFGTFKVSERAARTGINPATKKPLKIAAKKVAQFKAGKALSEIVNKK
ncbi:MAG: HU family DNA-binding protein [Bacteroidales bacterium]|nr:HU family DNA-binding protein [Bacteroidales bacterium]